MKWFGNTPAESNDEARALRSIEYLKKAGDRPEKWAAVRQLLMFISKRKLSNDTLKKAIDLKWQKINYRIATFADEDVLQMLVDSGLTDQKLYGIMIYNKALSKSQAEALYDLCDDSERGYVNRKQLYRKFGVGEEP
jgi:hypothetical protein